MVSQRECNKHGVMRNCKLTSWTARTLTSRPSWEGKEEACLVGMLKVGTEEMKSKGKGVVMDEGHYLGDGLWKMQLD